MFIFQIDDKITSADRNREKRQAEIKAKQKQRELRAQRARERAKRLEDAEGEELNFDMEKDDTFNNEDGRLIPADDITNNSKNVRSLGDGVGFETWGKRGISMGLTVMNRKKRGL